MTTIPDHAPESLASRVWRHRQFYAFISPFFISFAVLGLWPLIYSLYLSLVKWDSLTPATFVGGENFRTLLSDSAFWKALLNTGYMFLLYVPPMLVLAFLLAVALNGPIVRARAFFRAAVFLPCVTPIVVISIVFSIFTRFDGGLFNSLLGLIHLGPYDWQSTPNWTRVSIALLLIWRWTGYNMIFMLAGLQGINGDVYEAAEIDGATRFQTLTRITMPLMKPTFAFCTIMSLLGTVYMFEEQLLIDKSGIVQNIGILLFNNSFTNFKFGYASAMGYTIGVMVFLMTLMVRYLQKEDA